MNQKLYEEVFLKTKLDEVAGIYDGLLMLLESTAYKISIKETRQNFRNRGIKLKEAIISIGDQIDSVEFYYDRLIKLDEEISRLKNVNLQSITGIDENRDRAIKAFRTLGNFAYETKDNNERIDLNNFIERTRISINLALSILRHKRIFRNDSSFQDIDENDIVPETKETKILYSKDRFHRDIKIKRDDY
jgi:hypothetical protein